MFGLSIYLLVLIALAYQLPAEWWDAASPEYLFLIGAIGLWRYGWGAVNVVRGLIYMRIVFPRMRRRVERAGPASMPSHNFLLVTSFRIDGETTRRVYESVIAEAVRSGLRCTVIASIVEMGDHHGQRLVEAAMGVALRQQSQMRGHGLQPVDGDRAVHQPGGIHLDRLGLKDAEMLVEAGPPQQVDAVAGLQHRLLLARAAAAHQAEMAAMRARHHLENGAGFAMLAGAENDSLVAPFHFRSFSPVGSTGRKVEKSGWISIRASSHTPRRRTASRWRAGMRASANSGFATGRPAGRSAKNLAASWGRRA